MHQQVKETLETKAERNWAKLKKGVRKSFSNQAIGYGYICGQRGSLKKGIPS